MKNKALCPTGLRSILTVLIAVLLILAGTGLSSAQGVLSGIVTMDEPVSGGTILIYDGPSLIQTEQNLTFYNGTFSVQLNPAAAALLAVGSRDESPRNIAGSQASVPRTRGSSRDLRVKVLVNQSGSTQPGSAATLMADLHQFDPASQVIFINPVTTIISAYREIEPAASLADASSKVADTLGLPSAAASVACQSTHLSDFNNQAFMSASESQGGFDAFVQTAAEQVDHGDPLSAGNVFSVSNAADPNFQKLFLSLAQDAASQALVAIPFGKVFSGWVLDEIFNAPSQSTSEKDLIAPQLQAIGKQLDEVLAGIANLSGQIRDFEKSITDLVKLTAYQQQAQDAFKSINALCKLQGQLVLLADSNPDEDHTKYAENVQTQIQNSDDLENIWSALEGDDSLAVPGLINRWSDLVGPGPGYPIFTDNHYLTSAVPNFDYYLGAETVGYGLQIELGHALAFQKQPSLGNQIINTATSDFNDHYDTEVKRIAHDREIGGENTTGLFAAVALPSNFEAWSLVEPVRSGVAIDTRSGLMWMLQNSCLDADCRTSEALFAAYDKTHGWGPVYPGGPPIELASAFISDLNGELSTMFPDLSLKFERPTRDQWAGLIDSDREDPAAQNETPVVWLQSVGFSLPTTNTSYWTLDLANGAAGTPMLYPNWADWLVDLNVLNPNNAQFWWQISGTSLPQGLANMLLTSAAPLETVNQWLYKSGQDALTLTPSP